MSPNSRPMTLGQYLLVSLLAFRGSTRSYASDALARDRRLVLYWLQAHTDPETGADAEARAVLAGERCVGVRDGRVITRVPDAPLAPWSPVKESPHA